ncbi:hypothetical protein QBC43DRAFT_317918 [Cladorrhinum sp. PSN259]|nr:hypothetical protein QBC43DRAFT_317918 [Cladorrhinum sp. PSN259]
MDPENHPLLFSQERTSLNIYASVQDRLAAWELFKLRRQSAVSYLGEYLKHGRPMRIHDNQSSLTHGAVPLADSGRLFARQKMLADMAVSDLHAMEAIVKEVSGVIASQGPLYGHGQAVALLFGFLLSVVLPSALSRPQELPYGIWACGKFIGTAAVMYGSPHRWIWRCIQNRQLPKLENRLEGLRDAFGAEDIDEVEKRRHVIESKNLGYFILGRTLVSALSW